MRNMTCGAPRRHLIAFAVPLLLGNWLQLLYNAVDSIIAGRFIGRSALAAEGIAGPVMNLVILAISGLCIGAGVLMSEAYGAGDSDGLRRSLGSLLGFGCMLCTAVAAAGFAAAPLILRALAVPQDILDLTTVYLRITFLGAPFTFLYNALAAGFKSVGDTKTPLRFLAFSAILNAGLDLVFLGLLGFGIVCSAVTTVVAEAASAALAVFWLRKKTPELCPGRETLLPDRRLLARILAYGGPTALQQAVQPIGKVLIQGQVNALGVSAIAAFNAATRVDDFACIPEQGISAAISTYIAQNRGAGKRERILPGFFAGLSLEAAYWLLVFAVVTLLRTPIISLFIRGEGKAEVVALGSRYLSYMAVFYLWPAMTNGFQGFYRGMGKMKVTLLGTFIQTGIRVLVTLLLAPRIGLDGIAFACVTGWTAMLLFEVPYAWHVSRREKLVKGEIRK